jgi:hypothetical protein
MHEDKTYLKRMSNCRKNNSRYFIAFEGLKTEPLYFKGIRDKFTGESKNYIGLLYRDSIYSSASAPNRNVKFLKDYINWIKNSHMTMELLLGLIINDIEDELEDEERKKVIKLFKNHLIGSQDNSSIDVDKGIREIKELLQKNGHQDIDAKITPPQCPECYDSDRFFLVLDRDEGSFGQYEDIVMECEKNMIGVCITNPRFELWLALHFDIPLDEIISTSERKKSKNTDPLGTLLRRKMPKYEKNKLDFDLLKPGIHDAIRKEKLLCEDIFALKDKVGSNVGTLVEQLIS